MDGNGHGFFYVVGATFVVMLLAAALLGAIFWFIHWAHRRIDDKSALYPPGGWCETCRLRFPDIAEHIRLEHPGFGPPWDESP